MASNHPGWAQTCLDGPHAETGDPCGCPEGGWTCCLRCPLAICVLDQKDPKQMRRSVTRLRGLIIIEMLKSGVPKYEVIARLHIDHTQYRRAVEAINATP